MLKAMVLAYKRHAIYRATCKELAALSDKELRDIGIDRSIIEEVAIDAAYGPEGKPTFDFIKTFFKTKTDKDKIEDYLAEAENLVDLENRIKAVDRGLAPWQVRERNFAQGWMAS